MSPASHGVPPLTILVLSKRGHAIRAIARLLGISRNAVRRALRAGAQEPIPSGVEGSTQQAGPTKRRSKLDDHREAIAALIEKYPRLTALRVREEIQKRGFDGSACILRRLIRKLRPKPAVEPFDRIETAAGMQAQADWSPYQVEIGGEVVTAHALSLTLCYSRMLFVAFFPSEDLASLLAGLIQAFHCMGGVPVVIVFDNPTSIVAVRLGPVVQFQERLCALARHYGFTPHAARVRHPRDKAKVERPFQDIEANFVYARGPFESFEQLNRETHTRLETWNARVHKTTRERPVDLLAQERLALLPLPARDYDTRIMIPAGVSEDFTVPFDGVRYSVSPRLAGKRGSVRADEAWVEFIYEGTVVARHARSRKKGARIVLEEHRAELRAMRREARREALERRAGVDPDGYEERVRDFLLEFGDTGEKYLAALVATFRGGARHELRRTLEVRARVGEEAFRAALARAVTYGAAGGAAIERVAEDLIRRGTVERRRLDPTRIEAAPRPDVPVRPLSYYRDIIAREAAATPETTTTPEEEAAP